VSDLAALTTAALENAKVDAGAFKGPVGEAKKLKAAEEAGRERAKLQPRWLKVYADIRAAVAGGALDGDALLTGLEAAGRAVTWPAVADAMDALVLIHAKAAEDETLRAALVPDPFDAARDLTARLTAQTTLAALFSLPLGAPDDPPVTVGDHLALRFISDAKASQLAGFCDSSGALAAAERLVAAVTALDGHIRMLSDGLTRLPVSEITSRLIAPLTAAAEDVAA